MTAFREFIDFGELKVGRRVGQALTDMGFEEPTPIQAQAIPLLMEGKDVIGQAQTGTGKTAAFGIPIVEKVNTRAGVQSLVVTPTRELAIQVAEEISRIGRHRRIRTLPIYGGQSIDRQIRSLRQGVHVVIGTPGRLLDHLNRKTMNLSTVNMVVLDEADEMLDMGFIDDVESIIKATPQERQTLLFSATMPREVLSLAQRYLRDPEFITVSRNNLTVPQIDQVYYETREREKLDSLARLLDVVELNRAIIFCRTKRGVDELVAGLQARGLPVAGLHGDMSQYQRNQVMRQFKGGQVEILAATDVAARGLDIENVSHVINYDIPQDVEFYIHRIGRTGRAGKSGMAITLVSPRDYRQLRLIENLTKTRIRREKLPSLADVTERQKEGLVEKLRHIIEDGKLGYYRGIVDPLLDDYDPVDIAAAALKMSFGPVGEENVGETAGFGNTGAKPGMVRLFVTMGRKDNIRPAELVRIISDETGIPPNLVGDINIFEKFAFVEVNEEWASCVINYLHHSTVKGRRISVEPARSRVGG
ncbi:DEAD-box ATP-dependent RNA helicase CshA [Desulfocucumis palustris]|uniref:ATP-dependent RNA helicase CshA n=1 Tax=Desulfocucumis palustris TaxID=1898651 RepID=A0A2L2X926_9FIRM|nr:DEAD/DEAH box helicase [Desulfocucumis palustris]GBF32695.1 DEAD-box ATP-dependent RNA helicase CshA [Desulfocucumis palustris]